ncbi:sulfite exporter TauE/SafE family protein [Photorhabdus luminescens]|uniref:Probable membrane transporter protein n=1 Tax=Photorhabdus luminescens subsp. sonorensis TaxID=1173677 RepID=A0A5C4REV9_PHOLU|nr:sulfite exporter TauE/SafE family protein [Photorhabdus luminescens]TNH42522.1 sulfite exporter TauE/SafE family protein [Photorhabdus luminescens subsp. sonorensis]
MLHLLAWSDLLICIFVVFFAYLVFGMAGFGSALIASPILAFYIPVAKIVPMLALIDLTAAVINITREGKKSEFSEIKLIIPLMVIGSLIGAAILLMARPDALVLVLGLFVVFYSIYSLFFSKTYRQFPAKAAIPFGLSGGIFSALFGSGGFLYAIYLTGRISDKEIFRITQTTLIGFSTMTRVIIFVVMGIYLDTSFLLLILVFIPAMLLGIYFGRQVTLKISRETFLRFINIIVLASGLMLIYRYIFTL